MVRRYGVVGNENAHVMSGPESEGGRAEVSPLLSLQVEAPLDYHHPLMNTNKQVNMLYVCRWRWRRQNFIIICTNKLKE